MKKLLTIGLIFLISSNVVACSNKDVVRINDINISKDEYKKTEKFLYEIGLFENNKENRKSINDDVLSFMIDNEVVYQEAEKENITVKENEVYKKLEDMKNIIDSDNSLKDKLDKAGIDEEFLKSQVKKDLVISKYKENFIKNIKVSDKEIIDYYKNNKSQFKEEEIKASQILISTLDDDNKEVSNEEKERLKSKAEDLLKKINNKGDFASLAKEFSDDKNSGKDGGDLGYFSKKDKNIEFTDPVFKLAKNQVSDIIETSYGYHIVKVLDKKVITRTLEESKEEIKKRIINNKYVKHIDSLYKSGNVKII